MKAMEGVNRISRPGGGAWHQRGGGGAGAHLATATRRASCVVSCVYLAAYRRAAQRCGATRSNGNERGGGSENRGAAAARRLEQHAAALFAFAAARLTATATLRNQRALKTAALLKTRPTSRVTSPVLAAAFGSAASRQRCSGVQTRE